jgi:hypothetical protein
LLPFEIAPGGKAIELVAHRIDGGAVVEIAEALQKGFAIQSRQFCPIRFLDEKVEVVGHHHISDDTKTQKSLELAHEDDKVFALLVTEDEPPVHDA